MSRKYLRILKLIDWNKGLLYSSGNSVQCYVAAWVGGAFGGEWIHVYLWLRSCFSPETITTLLISYTPIQNKKLEKNSLVGRLKGKKTLGILITEKVSTSERIEEPT